MYCPGEEEDHGRAAFGFCGADGGDYAFEVVAAHCWDAVVVCVGVVEDGAGVGHVDWFVLMLMLRFTYFVCAMVVTMV